MPQIYKILILFVLILGAGFIGFSLRTPTREAPQDADVVSDSTQTTLKEETQEETPVTPPTGVTRDLQNQGITEVPRSEFDRTGTEILILSGNKLTSLQAEVRQLSELRVLDLSDNLLTNIPAEIGQLAELEILDLSNNRLTGLPYELGNLSNLKRLDLRGNAYAKADLEVIKRTLPQSTVILID